jgi:hypothetical protein
MRVLLTFALLLITTAAALATGPTLPPPIDENIQSQVR